MLVWHFACATPNPFSAHILEGARPPDWCRQPVKYVWSERWANCWTDSVPQLHLNRAREWMMDPKPWLRLSTSVKKIKPCLTLFSYMHMDFGRGKNNSRILQIWPGRSGVISLTVYLCDKWRGPVQLSIVISAVFCFFFFLFLFLFCAPTSTY